MPPRVRGGLWKARHRRRVLAIDATIVIGAVAVAQLVRFGVPNISDSHATLATLVVTGYSLALAAGWLVALGANGSRQMHASSSGVEEYRTVITATGWVFGSIALLGLISNQQMARGYLAIVLPVGLAGLLAGRGLWRARLARLRDRGEYVQQLVLVGSPRSIATLCRALSRETSAGYRVLGACVPGTGRPSGQVIETALGPIPVLGDASIVESVSVSTNADAVAVAAPEQLGDARMKQLAWHLESVETDLIVVPGMTDIAGPRLRVHPIDNLPLFYLTHRVRSKFSRYVKRAFDVVFASAVLILMTPFMVAIAIAVVLHDGGPVFFLHERVGFQGRTFKVVKFRTMYVDADQRIAEERAASGQSESIFYKGSADSRVTTVGAFLRKNSLDELPQLLNVIAGSMSVVGPRPLVTGEGESVEHFLERRSLVKPGITGLWQVSGRSDVSPDERIRLDHFYIDNWSFTQDLVIILRTVKAVLKRNGAY